MRKVFPALMSLFLLTACVPNEPKYSIKPDKSSSLSALISHQCLIEVGLLREAAIDMEDKAVSFEDAKQNIKRKLENKYDLTTTTRKALAMMSIARISEQVELMYSGATPPQGGVSPYRSCIEVSNEFVKLRGGDF